MTDTNVITPLLRPEFSNRSYATLRGCMHRARLRDWFSVIAAVLVLSGCASGATAAEAAKPAEVSKVAAPKEAELVVWNQPITVFRASFAGLTPEDRAAQAAERIQDLPLGSESAELKFETAKIGAAAGIACSIESRQLISLPAGDLAPDSNQTLNTQAQTIVTALRAALRARIEQRQWSTLLMSVA